MKRSEVAENLKWDLTKFCASDQKWYEEFEKLKGYVGKFEVYKGKLNNKKLLKQMLNLDVECNKIMDGLEMYAYHNLNTQLNNKTYSEMVNVLGALTTKLSTETSFVTPELLSYDVSYLNELKNDPNFKNNKMWFTRLINDKEHVLSEAEEKLISSMQNFLGDSSDIFDSITDCDFEFKDALDSAGKAHKVSNATYPILIKCDDRVLRKNTHASLWSTFKQYNNSLFLNYNLNLKTDNFLAKAKKFNDSFDYALYEWDVPRSVYNKLKQKVNQVVNLNARYYNLRRKAMGYEKLHSYDAVANITPHIDKKYTFEQAQQMILNGLKPLGEQYGEYVKQAYAERWVDVMPTEHKVGGGYSHSSYWTTPVILLNYTDDAQDVIDLAHELGHSIHSLLSNKAQPYETHSYPIVLAEIASTFNEILLIKYLIENAQTKEEKLFYVDKYLVLFSSKIFGSIKNTEFEEFAHGLVSEGKPISKDILNDKFESLSNIYNNGIEPNEFKKYGWSAISHFYTSFYMFQYATGLVAAMSFVNKVLNGSKTELNNYLGFLKSGGSNYPCEILKNAGINLEEDEPYDLAFVEMENALNLMEEIINLK